MLILLSLSGVTTLSLLAGVCAACMLAYRCLQMKWWAAVTVVAIPSQKVLLMCPYVFSGEFPVLAPRCSRALLHNLQLTSDRRLILASRLATGMTPASAIISRLLCLQGTRRSFKYFLKIVALKSLSSLPRIGRCMTLMTRWLSCNLTSSTRSAQYAGRHKLTFWPPRPMKTVT